MIIDVADMCCPRFADFLCNRKERGTAIIAIAATKLPLSFRVLPASVCEGFSAAWYRGLSEHELVEDSPWVRERDTSRPPAWREFSGDSSVGGRLVRSPRVSPGRCGPRRRGLPARMGFPVPPRRCGSTIRHLNSGKRPAEHVGQVARPDGGRGARAQDNAQRSAGRGEEVKFRQAGERTAGRQAGCQRWGSRSSKASSLAAGSVAGRRMSTSR